VFDVDQERHIACSSKDRTEIFDGFFGKLTEEHGRSIQVWLDSGEAVQQPSGKSEQQQPTGPKFISKNQVKELEEIISNVGADRDKYLAFLGVKRLEEIPAERMGAAIKALDAKTRKGDQAASNVTDITSALLARRIPFETKEEAGEVHAKPSYQDTASKEFLKAWYGHCGYRHARTATVEDAHPYLAPLLATPCVIEVYEKPLRAER